MIKDEKISQLPFGSNLRNNLITMLENGINKNLYLRSLSKMYDIEENIIDTTCLTSDFGKLFIGNCNQIGGTYGTINYYLPTGSDAIKGYPYDFQCGQYQGNIKVNVGVGSGQKILYKSQELDSFLIYSKGQQICFYWNGAYWIPIKKTDIIMAVNLANRSDWTGVQIGNGVKYDNKSAVGSLTGQVITEATSGFSAIIVYDDTINSILYYYELSSGFTYFTNNRELTASNGITCDVDEASGTNKNIDYNLYHGFGINLFQYNYDFFVSTDGTWNNSFRVLDSTPNAVLGGGYTIHQETINYTSIIATAGGLHYIGKPVGTGAINLTNQDYYAQLLIKF